MSKPTEVFASLADDYAQYRPGYPTGVLDELARACGLTRDSVIADIGSGTGNTARLFLASGYRVIGVEPNKEMREAGDRLLASYASFHILDGAAERIPLETQSVDLITVGQALHWFDVESARVEFLRILRPDGWIAVMWNDRRSDATEFTREYHKFTSHCAIVQPPGLAVTSLDTGLECLFGSVTPHAASFRHTQSFDLDGLLGRARSSGYVPQPGMPGHAELTDTLTDLFSRHQNAGAVEFHYIAKLYFGHLEDPALAE